MKVVIYGAGKFGELYCRLQGEENRIIAVTDSNKEKWGKGLCGHQIVPPSEVIKYDFDKIVITVDDYSRKGETAAKEIYQSLIDLGVSHQKILQNKLRLHVYDATRVNFVYEYAKLVYRHGWLGNVAEAGVYRGDFAAHINAAFPDRKLYLFDTFTGFDERDKSQEKSKHMRDWLEIGGDEYLTHGSAQSTLLKCENRNHVIIKQGYVPDTFEGLENEKYLFVNLDMDLYAPTIAALRYFLPRMNKDGIILLHDYYWWETVGIKQAVDEVNNEYKFWRLPIGDNMSVALLNFEKIDV